MNKIAFYILGFFISTSFSVKTFSKEEICKENLSQKTEECIRAYKVAKDDELNSEYNSLKDKISKSYPKNDPIMLSLLKNITESQRAWVKFRDLNCIVESSLAEEITPAHEMLVNKCIARMSHTRASELHEISKEY